jgi:hypothetical protein
MSEIEDNVLHFQTHDPLVPCLNMGGSQVKRLLYNVCLITSREGTQMIMKWNSPQNLWKFCQIDWVSFKVGWPSEGFLDQETIHKVYQAVTGMPGHSDQFPYIDIGSHW